jgi:UDP-N-acetylglucosamine:LPS N-acetylglucosamine transferase
VIDNQSLDGENLKTIILSLLEDESRRAGMSERLRAWSKVDADDLAAGHILDLVVSRRHLDNAVLQPGALPE